MAFLVEKRSAVLLFSLGKIDDSSFTYLGALQMFTGIYRVSIENSECGDFKFMGIARYLKSR